MTDPNSLLSLLIKQHRRELAARWTEHVLAGREEGGQCTAARQRLTGWAEAFLLLCRDVLAGKRCFADDQLLKGYIENCLTDGSPVDRAARDILAMPRLLQSVIMGERLMIPMEEEKQVARFRDLVGEALVAVIDHYASQAFHLRHRVIRLTRVFDFLDALHACVDVHELVDVVAAGAGNLLSFDYGMLGIISKGGSMIRVYPFSGSSQAAADHYQIGVDESIVGRVLTARTALFVDNLRQEPLPDVEAAIVERQSLKTVLMVPIADAASPIGALLLFNPSMEGSVSGEAEEVEAVTGYLGQLIRIVLGYEELRDQMDAMDKAARESADDWQARVRAVEDVAHDLKAPLSSVSGYTEMMLTEQLGPISPRQIRALAVCRRNVDRLLCMINSMLDIPKAREGHMEIAMEPVGLDSAVYQCIDMLQSNFCAKRITCRLELEEDALFVRGDHDKILRIVLNLVGNALKHTPIEGMITIGSTRVGGNRIEAWVEDNGSGIPHSDLDSIFDRFKQVHRGSGRDQGAGLGLAISKSIVEAHGGRIRVDSKEGEGSTFYFDLPAADPDEVILEA